MIIHINGASGSGKSTLGNYFKKYKDVVILDTDAFDDPSALKAMTKFDIDKQEKKWDQYKGLLNKKKLDEFIKKNHDKTIIIIGLLHDGFDKIKVDYGFTIKIDSETLYKQYTLRTLKNIKRHHTEITRLIKSKKSQTQKHYYLCYKYEIRNGLDGEGPIQLKKSITKKRLEAKKRGYMYAEKNKIRLRIVQLLKNR
mgnify:CR=1 FL=1|tara:strand:+ start:1362 stop:1952 length:591 start_codon:yes stop_codon:yes gene_type:complete